MPLLRRRSSRVVPASGEDYNDQNVPVGTVVSRCVVSGLPEGRSGGGAQGGGGQPGSGAPMMSPQQVRAPTGFRMTAHSALETAQENGEAT